MKNETHLRLVVFSLRIFSCLTILLFSQSVFAASCKEDLLLLHIKDATDQSWEDFVTKHAPKTGNIDLLANGSKRGPEKLAVWFLKKANGHMYPFYFYQQGVVQRIRKLVKLESSADALLEKSVGKNVSEESTVFAPEVRLWIDRAKSYQDNLKNLVQTTSIIRQQSALLEAHLNKATQYPTIVRFPQLVPGGNMPDDFVIEWVSEEFESAKSLKTFMDTLKTSNADSFKKVGSGKRKEFWYMASRHHEQAMLLYQLDIFRTEVVKFAVKAQSDRLKKMSREVELLLSQQELQPPRDYKLGFLRQVTLSEFGYYFGKLRDMDDMGLEATLELRLEDIIDLGVNPVLLSPQRKILRYLMASSPAIVFSGVAYWWGDDARDALKAKLLKYQSEEELVEILSKIENDVEFMDEFSKVVRARFNGSEDELGMIRFEDEEAAAEFSKKVREERMKVLGIRRKSKLKEHEILLGPKTSFPDPNSPRPEGAE